MAAFIIIIVGILQVLGGVAVFAGSKSAIHEILGSISFGMGVLSIALAVVIMRLSDIREAAQAQRKIFDDRLRSKSE